MPASWVIMALEMGLEAQRSAQEWALTPRQPPLQSESTGLGEQARRPANLGRFQHVRSITIKLAHTSPA